MASVESGVIREDDSLCGYDLKRVPFRDTVRLLIGRDFHRGDFSCWRYSGVEWNRQYLVVIPGDNKIRVRPGSWKSQDLKRLFAIFTS